MSDNLEEFDTYLELRGAASTVRDWDAGLVGLRPNHAADVIQELANRIERAADRIDALEGVRADMTAWQPIETARNDAGHVLFFGSTRDDQDIVFSGWVAKNGMFYADTGQLCRPTHWMPLPAPPAQEGEA